jgi:RNA polymerase-binding transcription factor DksA
MDETAARRALLAERAAAQVRLESVTRDFESIATGSDGTADDEHDPEGATIAFERAAVAALVVGAGAHLAAVDGALARLGDGTYAACHRCGGPIGAERLTALPATPSCVACAGGPGPGGHPFAG